MLRFVLCIFFISLCNVLALVKDTTQMEALAMAYAQVVDQIEWSNVIFVEMNGRSDIHFVHNLS
ncbi:hypothetical protein [Paraglaciecola sp. L1A13]|uniref:hypothetical protein n=1 Tax=Paraglaciecola sp. L1A13 TaxID=2686359 RepID=UPI00131D7592|nr:hypothetical protein [Paraglaciecola sp. L1A13]